MVLNQILLLTYLLTWRL